MLLDSSSDLATRTRVFLNLSKPLSPQETRSLVTIMAGWRPGITAVQQTPDGLKLLQHDEPTAELTLADGQLTHHLDLFGERGLVLEVPVHQSAIDADPKPAEEADPPASLSIADTIASLADPDQEPYHDDDGWADPSLPEVGFDPVEKVPARPVSDLPVQPVVDVELVHQILCEQDLDELLGACEGRLQLGDQSG